MNNIDIINSYSILKEKLDDSRNFFCFNTQNGRRLIVKVEDIKSCIAIDKNFRAVSFAYENPYSFYSSPLELIESYISENHGVEITDLYITMDKEKAYEYLIGEN